MDRNNVAILVLVGAGVLAAIALGLTLRAPTADVAEPVDAAAATATADPAPAPAKHKPAGARAIPDFAPAPSYTTAPSTLQYFDHVVGTGDAPQPGSMVRVEYTGWLEDGTMFDSSYKRAEGFAFPLGKGAVIKGWDEGVAGMKAGGKRQLKIPGDLAYGPRGRPPTIPPNATLIFDVELLAVMPPRVAPEKPAAVPGYTTTESGLQYHDLVVGTGAEVVKGSNVKVDYAGWLEDGTRFDSSLERNDPIPLQVGAGRVIKGWDEGLVGMRVGGKRQLKIPPDLAYGPDGRKPVIPPAATLIFDVEIVEVR